MTRLRDHSIVLYCHQEQNAEEYEDKEWTFVIENVSLHLSYYQA